MTASSHTIRFATEADVPVILSLIYELAAYENASSSVLATESSLLATLSFGDDPASSSSSHPSPRGYARTLLIFPPPPPSSLPSSLLSSSSSSYPNTTTTISTTNTTNTDTICAGMALYYISYSTWLASPGIFLEDLYIRPEFRKRGFGKLLIERLAREAVEISGECDGAGDGAGEEGGGGGGRGRGSRGRLEWNVLKWNKPSLNFYQNLGAVRLDEWVGMRVDGDRLVELAGQGGGEKGGE